jgi:VWFA-related protein
VPRFNIIFGCALCLLLARMLPQIGHAQQAAPPDTPDDVFRVTTELVQADVIVVDRQGRFVDNLKREQFELLVDGKPEPITFFDRVHAGPFLGTPQLSDSPVAEGPSTSTGRPGSTGDTGRTVLFFVDDFHLAFGSLGRVRNTLFQFIDSDMGPDDRVAIYSTSGQIGFLQQLTSNKAALKAAVARLNSRTRAVMDLDRPIMNAHQAHIIDGAADQELFEYFVRETQRQIPFLTRTGAENIVLGRARQLVAQVSDVTRETLGALDALVRSNAELPGRKVVFFVSDGFELDFRNSNVSTWLQRIADEAGRSGVVVYSIDARGLSAQPGFDATQPTQSDPTGVLNRTNTGEIYGSQAPLYRLAEDTGGRALLNSNDLGAAIPRALDETSTYYLLAWTPEEAQKNNRFHRVELSVKGRPELKVRAPRGFYDAPPPSERVAVSSSRKRGGQAATPPATAESVADAGMLSALRSTHPVQSLPVSLSLGFVDTASSGMMLTTSIRFDAMTLDFSADDGTKKPAVLDVVNAVFDDKGKGVSSSKQRLTIAPSADSSPKENPLIYSHQFRMKPGLYQVRVAARDRETGRAGSAMEWIEIPSVSGGPFVMSSIIAERPADMSKAGAATQPMTPSVDQHLERSSKLRFLAYIYNAAHTTSPPDVALKVQIFHDDRPVIATPLVHLKTEGVADLSRIPYFAEVNLEGMPRGSYVLHVTAFDRTARASTSRRMNFEID